MWIINNHNIKKYAFTNVKNPYNNLLNVLFALNILKEPPNIE